MIEAPISKNNKINQAVTKILRKNKDADKDTKLLLKFQINMLLAKSSDGSNVLLIACLSGSKLIEFVIQQAIRLGIKDMLLN